MAKKRIAMFLLSAILTTTPLIKVETMQVNSRPIKTNCVENLNFRNYTIEQVEGLMKLEFEKQKEIEIQKQKEEQKKIENRIYCKFEVSFYTTSADEGSGTGIGASGEYVQPWVSIALPKDIPFYSTAYIEGLGEFIHMDTGSYIQWDYDNEGDLVCRADVCVSTKDEAFNLGRFYADGYIDIKN